MKRSELAALLYYKESYLQSHWAEIEERLKKQGTYIYKVGREPEANYGVQFPWMYEICWDTDVL